MPPPPQLALETLASQAFVSATPLPGNAFVFTAAIEGLPRSPTVVEAVLGEQIEIVPINLSVILKNLRFEETPITDPSIIGGMPVADSLTASLSQVTHEAIPPAGVPGVLAALTGTLPVPVQAMVETTLDVRANVRWTIQSADGDQADDVYWRIGAGGAGLEGSGGAISPPFDRALDQVRLAFVVVRELTTGSATNLTEQRSIGASLQLSAGGYASDWVNLPPLTVEVPVIRLPTMLAMFAQGQLQDSVFIAVPSNSALAIAQEAVSNTIQSLSDTLGNVQDVIDVATFVTGLGDLKGGIDQAPKFRVEFRTEIENFEDFILEDNLIFNETWDNTMSSLIFLGPRGRRVQCFNAPDHHTNEGAFEMTVTGLIGLIEIRELHVAAPVREIEHAATFRVTNNPPGDRTWPRRDVYGFGNEMSGIKFA